MAVESNEQRRIANFQDLLEVFVRDNVPHRADPEQQRVALPTKHGSLQGELLILWDARSSLLQCIQPLPFEVPQDRIGAAESAIARINHALMLPGFGLNHVSRLLYYRLSVPRRDDGTLSVLDLQRLISTTVHTAADFYIPLLGICLEGKPPEQVMAEAAARSSTDSK
jgi:hypothetical protein